MSDRARRVTGAAAAGGLAVLALVGCGAGSMAAQPADRAVALTTTACGDASSTRGSGILVGGGRLLTAAHLVIGAGSVSVDLPDGRTVGAAPAVVDTTRDLAVLRLDADADLDAVPLAEHDADSPLRLIGSAESGDLAVPVLRRADLVVDEVRGTARHRRGGYELDVGIRRGDSGAGLYTPAGHLAGVLFARSRDRASIAFAIDADEIRTVLATEPISWRCEPDRSRIVPVDS